MRVFLGLFCALPLLAADPKPSKARLTTDLEFLTSKELAGRASLTPGAKMAADFVAKQFREAGLQPGNGDSFFQEFKVTANTLDPDNSFLRLGGVSLPAKSAFTGAFHRDISMKAEAVFVGYGITATEYGYDDYKGIEARGKIVFILDREPQEGDPNSIFLGLGLTRYANYRSKLRNAQAHGAAAMVVMRSAKNRSVSGAGSSPTRGNAERQIEEGVQIPFVNLNEEAAGKLIPNWRSLQEKIDQTLANVSFRLDGEVELRLVHSKFREGVSWNVVGLLEGSDPALKSETVLLTSHYDHLPVLGGNYYPGANDNGSGTVAVIELARLFHQVGAKPKRSVLFVSFGSEENFLLGSFHYVDHPLRPLATTSAVINLDMVARDEAHTATTKGRLNIAEDTHNSMNLVGSEYSPQFKLALLRANKGIGFHFDEKFEHDPTQNILFRCDHYPFLLADVPSVWIFGGLHPGYHEPVDTMDRLNFRKLERVIRLSYRATLDLANGAQRPAFQAKGQ